jgi:pimeloyl-ACP methyl ester carboxylesterase
MSLEDNITLTRLLARLSMPAKQTPSNVREQRDASTPSGAVVDLYEPRGRTRGAVVAIHGVTVNGGKDERLVHFARSLAAVGVACAVPTLPRLAACQWEPSDVDVLGEVFDLLENRTNRRPGLIGFSHGASYALVLASRDEYRERARFVLAFGPYLDLNEVLRDYTKQEAPDPADAEAVDNWIYLHFVLALGIGERAGLSGEVASALATMMGRYCHEATAAEKQAFFQKSIEPLDMLKVAQRLHAPDVLAAVSPSGKLDRVLCPVSLVHDVHDGVVPPAHSRRIHEELQRRGSDRKQTLLLTRLLSHVALRDALRLGELGRLLKALRPVVLAG